MVDICRQLDGIPLAIELAAARVRLLSLTQIEQRLRDNFRILSSGNRIAPGRQQTLRTTIEWSYGPLSDAQRRLFQQLSVFAGGWTRAAAEAVCGGEGRQSDEVLDLLTVLGTSPWWSLSLKDTMGTGRDTGSGDGPIVRGRPPARVQ